AAALAQSRCGPNDGNLPGCDKTPAKPPFAATGWKTVMLDHFSMQVVDYQKEAAYFQALMNWKIRSDDGTKAVLDIGDWGGLVIRGGFRAPAQPVPAAAAVPGVAAGRGATTGSGTGGTGGGATGRGGGGGLAPRTVVIDSFCWGI